MNLVHPDHPILRQPCGPVTDIPNQVRPYLDDMVKLMRKRKGVGLAAPQVGIALRFFLIRTVCMINPFIMSQSVETNDDFEGCLSLPGYTVGVKRYNHLFIGYTKIDGEYWAETLTGDRARVFQHELDHINGKVIFPKDHYSQEPPFIRQEVAELMNQFMDDMSIDSA